MSQNKIISSEQLLELVESQDIKKAISQKAKLVQIAISDYPSPIQEPIDYLNILEHEIGSPLAYSRIASFRSKLSLKDGNWKAESLSVILNIFHEDKTITLNDIINELSDFYFAIDFNKL